MFSDDFKVSNFSTQRDDKEDPSAGQTPAGQTPAGQTPPEKGAYEDLASLAGSGADAAGTATDQAGGTQISISQVDNAKEKATGEASKDDQSGEVDERTGVLESFKKSFKEHAFELWKEDRNRILTAQENNRQAEIASLNEKIKAYNTRMASSTWAGSILTSGTGFRNFYSGLDMTVGGKKASISDMYARREELMKGGTDLNANAAGTFDSWLSQYMPDTKDKKTDSIGTGKLEVTPVATYRSKSGTFRFRTSDKPQALPQNATEDEKLVFDFMGRLGKAYNSQESMFGQPKQYPKWDLKSTPQMAKKIRELADRSRKAKQGGAK